MKQRLKEWNKSTFGKVENDFHEREGAMENLESTLG